MLRPLIVARVLVGGGLMLALTTPASAQTLRARIDTAPAGSVQFSFAARPDACADGQAYIRTVESGVSWVSTISETTGDVCMPGPVYVTVDRDERAVVALRTSFGRSLAVAGTTDLGRVSARDAAEYLLALAGSTDGRVGRDAISPAALADSADIAPQLTAIARNRALARETRTSAISHLARTGAGRTAVDALVSIAQQEDENMSVRRQALSSLARAAQGAGLPALITMSSQSRDPWTVREAMSVIAASGDPRARAHLRSVVQQDGVNDDVRVQAIRGLGQRYATAQDATLLRTAYARIAHNPAREAILTSIADIGGGDNVRWLLERTNDELEPAARRKRALESAARAGARTADLIRIYDTVGEHQLKDALVTLLGKSGERIAVDKLIDIARTETNVNVRRRAISTLGASDDPRVKEVLAALVSAK